MMFCSSLICSLPFAGLLVCGISACELSGMTPLFPEIGQSISGICGQGGGGGQVFY